MKILTTIFCFHLILSLACCGNPKASDKEASCSLKEALGDRFHIGAALNINQIRGYDTASLKIVQDQFSSIVAENCMKSMYLQPEEGRFFFDDADKFVAFGEQNDMLIIGHTLIWHSQAPSWFFTDDRGNDISPEILKERMKNHIYTVVGRYKGRIHGWDVVNEAILDNGEWRKSKFYEILGEEFIPLAFQYAHEADPDAELYYNDYNEWIGEKRDAIVDLVKTLKEKGLRVDGVGMQGHIGVNNPSTDEYRSAIDAYAAAGVKVMITEFDMSVLPSPRRDFGANIADTEQFRAEMNPYPDVLPDSVAMRWHEKMVAYFTLFLDQSDKISRVTMWGVTDRDSWKNDFPMRGRTDYPLLFDRKYQPKPIVRDIMDAAATRESTPGK
ncbi:endo-1,4-beta-xylanase [Proteiniphilum sp. X52]|uniref:endo-1,4-beta-xylanase n=1 Tax=Proteiniphilum sp. X52 TaxID=2382159 RepID=UPI000F0A215E|nr:endo-1,4-beta-xylanase [Proteiniphilum sp. X52]RNC65539.1 endo-1,4-beta-xylanase [Proteiniphilum sp. X52]